jgi:prepilin-type N-terminal cleavage/methylation domain-containing protein
MMPSRRNPFAFTLMEIMVVIAIMALLTSAAALSFTGPLRAAQAQDAIEQVRAFDASSRLYARRFGKETTLVFDVSTQTLARREGVRHEPVYQAHLPRGCSIERVRCGDRIADSGEIAIPCSSLGLTRSYTVHLVGPSTDRWISFAGLSGEMTVTAHDPDDANNFAAPPAPPRNDAD